MEEQIKALISAERYDDAFSMLNKAIQETPTNDELFYLRGFLYKQIGNWGEALSDLNRALELNPESKASVLHQLLQDIMDFRYTDLCNP